MAVPVPTMRAMFSRVAVIAVSLAAVACTDLECGEGTHEETGVCLPNIQTVCAEGTHYEQGYCYPDDVGQVPGDAADASQAEVRDSAGET